MPDLERQKELLNEMLQTQLALLMKPSQIIHHLRTYIKLHSLPLVIVQNESGEISIVDQ